MRSSCVPEDRLSFEPCVTKNLGKRKERGGERITPDSLKIMPIVRPAIFSERSA